MHIDQTNYESFLLSYIDGELTEQENRELERYCAGHPEAARELDLLRQTVLVPPVVVFPQKATLYREEHKRRFIGAYSWRAAVLAIVLAGGALLYYLIQPAAGTIKETDGKTGKIGGTGKNSTTPDSVIAVGKKSATAPENANGIAKATLPVSPGSTERAVARKEHSLGEPGQSTAMVRHRQSNAIAKGNADASRSMNKRNGKPAGNISEIPSENTGGTDETALAKNPESLPDARSSRVSIAPDLSENQVSVRVNKNPQTNFPAANAVAVDATQTPVAIGGKDPIAGDDAVSVIHLAKTGNVVGKLFRRLSRGNDDSGQTDGGRAGSGAEKKVNISVFQFAMSR